MTANQHPYPAHVQTAVADAIADLYANATTWEQIEAADDEVADVALQALWDASRVDTLDELDDLPWDYVVIDRTGFVSDGKSTREDIHDDDLPAHVIYWGNHDR